MSEGEIGLFFALAAGVLSFFSPCVFPLLPAYVTHLTDGKIENGKIQTQRGKIFWRSTGFVIGFSTIFIMLGASASAAGQFLMEYRLIIMQVAGVLIIVFGLQMTGLINLKLLLREKKVSNGPEKVKSFPGSVLLGMAFASGWSPCVGLALSSILMLASQSDTVNQGIVLLAVYSAGMAIPFLVISLFISFSLKLMKKINKYLSKLSVVNGVVMIAMGFFVLSGEMQRLSAWLALFSPFQL